MHPIDQEALRELLARTVHAEAVRPAELRRLRAAQESALTACSAAKAAAPKREARRGTGPKTLDRRQRLEAAYKIARELSAQANGAYDRAVVAAGQAALAGLLVPKLQEVVAHALPEGLWARIGPRTVGTRKRYFANGWGAWVDVAVKLDALGLPETLTLSRTQFNGQYLEDEGQYAATFKTPSMWDMLYTLRASDKWGEQCRSWTLDSHVGHGCDAQDVTIIAKVQSDVSKMMEALEAAKLPTLWLLDMAVHGVVDVATDAATYATRPLYVRDLEDAFPQAKESIRAWLVAHGVNVDET